MRAFLLLMMLALTMPYSSEARMVHFVPGESLFQNLSSVEAKRTAILGWIADLPSQGKVMSGQMSWSDATIEAVNTNYGKYPALRGFDWFAQSDPTLSRDIKEWAASNGMAHLMYHMPNPFNANAVYSSMVNGNWTDLITEGTTTNNYWKVSLNKMADTFKRLQRAEVVVLFRPFHEMNGHWFWWSAENAEPAEFQAAWIYLYNYMTVTKGLKNIIWVYGPNVHSVSVVDQYPGHAYVDIVALDVYGSSDFTNYLADNAADLATVSGGKPFAVSEYGACISSGCSSGGANASGNIPTNLPSGTTFWMSWESGPNNYFGLDQANAGTATIFANPAVLTLDEMPSF